MLAEVRGRSQITIPADLVQKMGIHEGDKFEIMERDGGIFLCPVVVYPKAKLAKIAQMLKDSEDAVRAQSGYDSVDAMFADMGIDTKNV